MKASYSIFKEHFVYTIVVLFISLYVFSAFNPHEDYLLHPEHDELEKPWNIKDGWIYIIHYNDDTWWLSNPVFEGSVIHGKSSAYTKEFTNRAYKLNKSKRSSFEEAKLSNSQIHLFLKGSDYNFEAEKSIVIRISDIQDIKLYNENGRTNATVKSGSTGSIPAILAITAATKSSCPFAYSFDGKEYNLEGEIFSGAIFKPLERGDYLKLNYLYPHEGMYKIAISNELKEVQYINHLELMVVNAQAGAKILLDKDGKPQSIMQKNYCISSTDINAKDVSYKLYKPDDQTYLFDDLDHNVNQLDLEFSKPTNSNNMKLVMKARSSFWVDYLWGEYSRFYGKDFDTFIKERNNAPKEMLLNWKKQSGLPLTISLLKDNKWVKVQELEHTGPIAFRELVVPIDLEGIADNLVHVRITTGYQFWEIDYVYADFSENVPINVSYINPVSAVDHLDRDLRSVVVCDDDQYVILPTTDDELHLLFEELSPANGTQNNYFLYAKGYYNHIRDFSMAPPPSEIPGNYMDPEFLMEFSREKFNLLMDQKGGQ